MADSTTLPAYEGIDTAADCIACPNAGASPPLPSPACDLPFEMPCRLGSRSDCQGQGRATLVLCKAFADLDTVLTWSYRVATRIKQDVQLDNPNTWHVPIVHGPELPPLLNLAARDAIHDEGKLDRAVVRLTIDPTTDLADLMGGDALGLGPEAAALWISGVVRPTLGVWQDVQGGVRGFTPGMR